MSFRISPAEVGALWRPGQVCDTPATAGRTQWGEGREWVGSVYVRAEALSSGKKKTLLRKRVLPFLFP